ARASRKPPPSRRPRGAVADRDPAPAPAPDPAPSPSPDPPAPATPPPARPRASRRRGVEPTRLAADLPPVNLAIRVRKPLDDHLADLIHGLRGVGVRTSKVELIEMLLWELPKGEDAPQQ